ncbi:hypothetical protein PR202_gb15122 [Eleusine coracana subsp. coracana]|uniref:Gamma-tubulin complex component n=1 Tax=Eleusine coracana subsp. coracana TaxID=191504 RepID=A0AAV5EUU8_ELECO|nr:hypothetical protein PR202_gb15122 [Eleusine coracana subsp. coracana]
MDHAPATPRWNLERPYLTGGFYQEAKAAAATQGPGSKPFSLDPYSRGAGTGSGSVIGSYAVSVQELFVIDDLLSALVGIEGRYISIKKVRGKDGYVAFQIDSSMDLALQELTRRIFPLCENFVLVNQFVESRSHYKNGLVNHALAAALRAFLLDYQAMVAQLEHQFRLGRLSVQGLWFSCQRMMSSMNALAVLVQKAISNNTSGSATLNLLQSQAKAMGGDSAVRVLTGEDDGMWVYEGVIDDPYGEFFIAENKSLQKESLTQDYDAKYWQQRYSLKDGVPSFLTDVAATILTTGKYLNVMRECGHNVQVSLSENSKLMSFGSNHQYLECIKSAYDFASGELLTLMKDKYDLIGKLRSLKRYLLLDQSVECHGPNPGPVPAANKLAEIAVQLADLARQFKLLADLEKKATKEMVAEALHKHNDEVVAGILAFTGHHQNEDDHQQLPDALPPSCKADLLYRQERCHQDSTMPGRCSDAWLLVEPSPPVEAATWLRMQGPHAWSSRRGRHQAVVTRLLPRLLWHRGWISDSVGGGVFVVEATSWQRQHPSNWSCLGRLCSLQMFNGDFLVHFMDIAREELTKKPEEISTEKLQERSSLLKKLTTLKDLDCAYPSDKLVAADVDQTMQLSITGLETFYLSYKVFRPVKILGTPILRSSILCGNMLKFVNSLLHYLTFEVLEPNWHLMHDRLQTARSIDEVIQIHDFFLQKCLKECLLLLPELLMKVEKLKSLCLQYATSIQLLIPSIEVSNPDKISKPGKSRSRINKLQEKDQQLKLVSENAVMSESILKLKQHSIQSSKALCLH